MCCNDFDEDLRNLLKNIDNILSENGIEGQGDISTKDFTWQVYAALKDVFTGEVTVEDINCVRVAFPESSTFKINIIKL